VERWIAEARNGSRDALEQLLAMCRPYLLLAANEDLDPTLRARLGPSDVVQETLLEALRDFPAIHGDSEDELLAWLRKVLRHNLANERRRHIETELRSTHREMPLAEVPVQELQESLADSTDTPSTLAQTRERDETLDRALRQLPEPYRQALLWHTTEGWTFAEIGAQLGMSSDAARKLWGRAAEELARLLGEKP
jgi:RNA polymerase sigma-70 factor (ECF subfamily)